MIVNAGRKSAPTEEKLREQKGKKLCILCDKIDQGFAHPLIKTVRGVGYEIEA
jgi:hypothetical protein